MYEELAEKIVWKLWAGDPEASHCTAHMERTGRKIRAYRLGLCRRCFDGHPISKDEWQGLLSEDEDDAIRERHGRLGAESMLALERRRQARAEWRRTHARLPGWLTPMIFGVVRIYVEEGETTMLFSITALNLQQQDAYERIAHNDIGRQIIAVFLRCVQAGGDRGAYVEDVLQSPHFVGNADVQREYNAHQAAYESALRVLFGDALRSKPARIGTADPERGIIDVTRKGAPKQVSLSETEAKDPMAYRRAKLEAGADGVVVVHKDGDGSARLFVTPGSAPGSLPLPNPGSVEAGA